MAHLEREKNTTAAGARLQDPPRAIYGWKLHASMAGLSLALLFSALESTIISTSLITIGDSFGDYANIEWVVTAYLVTYSSFLLSYARLTDTLGQRNVLLFALIWFAIFSGLCGAAESMSLTHLIIFRALQGIGGSGIYSVVFIALVDICPARWFGMYSGVVSSTFAIANAMGPTVGGAICDSGDWKWIFLLNVPGAVVAGLVLLLCFPGGDGKPLTWANIAQIDYVGAFLSVGSAALLLYGLQSGGTDYGWSSPRIIATISAGVIGGAIFFAYEYLLARPAGHCRIEAIFPIRLLSNPRIMILLLCAFSQGCVFYATVINIPQLVQITHGASASRAGISILPLLLVSSFASFISASIFSKTVKWGWMILSLGAVLATLGIGLLIELPLSQHILPRQYGYETVLGFGLGIGMPAFLVLGRVEVADKDNASIMGSVNSSRTMGGCIALSLCSAILHSRANALRSLLPPTLAEEVIESPTTALVDLDYEQAYLVRKTYAEIYRLQWVTVTALGAVGLVASLGPVLWSSIKPNYSDRADNNAEGPTVEPLEICMEIKP